jgi:hypothetical protein
MALRSWVRVVMVSVVVLIVSLRGPGLLIAASLAVDAPYLDQHPEGVNSPKVDC